jgi:DNA-binding CsgD family transcriptional regulator/uncharacterized coiled-coil protein SlyX
MGFWDWLKNRKKSTARQRSPATDEALHEAFGRVKQDIQKLDDTVAEINRSLTQHTELLEKHNALLDNQTNRLGKLEEMVSAQTVRKLMLDLPINRPPEATNRLIESTPRLIATKSEPVNQVPELDLQTFSPQEKKILKVFLAHRHMALSYLDLAKALGKSPHTVKNQLRQMNIKSELFDKITDDENKNRFKLKKHLNITTTLDPD